MLLLEIDEVMYLHFTVLPNCSEVLIGLGKVLKLYLKGNMEDEEFAFDLVGCVVDLIVIFSSDLESYFRDYISILIVYETKIKVMNTFKLLNECLNVLGTSYWKRYDV